MNARGIPENQNVLPCDHRHTGRMGMEPASRYPPICASFLLSNWGGLAHILDHCCLTAQPSAAVPPALGQGWWLWVTRQVLGPHSDIFKTISSLFTRKLGMLAPGCFLSSWKRVLPHINGLSQSRSGPKQRQNGRSLSDLRTLYPHPAKPHGSKQGQELVGGG